MRYVKWISTVDSHTAGECTRLVMSGLPPVRGNTMAGKMAYAAENLAWAPGLLMLEPRGHKDMYGALLTPPSHPEADTGVIYMDNQGFEPMCGHATIGVVTTLIEMGVCPPSEPETVVTLDTPAGTVRARAQVKDGAVQSVSFEGVPSFVFRQDACIAVPGIGGVAVDIAFGGNFFAMVRAEQLGLELVPAQATRLADAGMRILAALNVQIAVCHPDLPHIDRVIDLRFYTEPGSAAHSRNTVILGDHMVDRSPCGTGTCAELALRYARGKLGLGEPLVVESILGTRFTGRILRETQVGSGNEAIPAVIPEITGSAYITGIHQFALDPRDPFPEGFLLV